MPLRSASAPESSNPNQSGAPLDLNQPAELLEADEVDQEGEADDLEEVEEEEEEEEEEGGGDAMEDEEGNKEVPQPMKEKTKQRDFEVFVGGLPRDATEDDLREVFMEVGEVVEVRLAKNPYSNKNKGFGFVRFATVEQAKRAVTELKETKVRGKVCGVIKSNDNETLHLGNICTTWTKDDLLENLKELSLENLEDVHMIEDPTNRGKNRGYAFLDFSTHMDAVAACSKLQKREIFLGTNVRAEVSFSKTVEPDEEVMSQVKSVFLDGLPPSWDEAEVRERFKKFGEIENVQLARNMPTAKRKDFGFICFTTRQAALDCIEQVNNDGVGEGSAKVVVKATLKRPLQKRTPQSLAVRRGYIGKSYAGRGSYSDRSVRPNPGRLARSHELIGQRSGDRFRVPSRYSSRDFGVRMSSPAGGYGAHYTRQIERDMPAAGVGRTRDAYLESSSRRAVGSYRELPSTYHQSRRPYSTADIYDPRLEQYEVYEHPSASGYRRSYTEMDRVYMPSSSLSRHGRRSHVETGVYADYEASTYDEYSRLSPDERYGYDRVEYASRDNRSYYLPRSGASRSYH